MRAIDLTSKKFCKLTVLGRDGKNNHGQLLWKCLCDCGGIASVVATRLNTGHTKSCGCLQVEVNIKRSTKHGQNRRSGETPEYRAWNHMKTRCYNSNIPRFENHGGRGITVCDRWLTSFDNFFQDMGLKPSPEHSLDRFPDNDGIYEPSNCRWGTDEQQARNRRSSKLTEEQADTIRTSKLPQAELARIYGVSPTSIYYIKSGRNFKKKKV